MAVVSPFFTFPPVSWWMHAVNAGQVIFDSGEHFEKMTNRNRYHIAGANNKILLSVPLVNGRNQHIPMKEVRIYNDSRWQLQHWRTLVSVYKRAPYFYHYEDSLRPLFEMDFTHLIDFNKAGLDWVQLQLKLNLDVQETQDYIKEYPPEVTDLRFGGEKESGTEFPAYYQVFEDRLGFLPNLSILDLIFSEGPLSVRKLEKAF